MAVHFFFLAKNTNLNNRRLLKAQIELLFSTEGYKLSNLNYIFCSDETLLGINQVHLNHNYYTDIITFDLSPKNGGIEGEIYISIDMVRENATLLGVKMKEELHRVIFHGALHLCGYKDKRKGEKITMRKRENYYLVNYFKKLHVEH